MIITSAIRNEVFTGKTNVINWDGYGYYVYLPAIFIYGDIEDYSFTEEHFKNYEISGDLYQVMKAEDGAKFPIYNIGLALVWAPAFLLTHAVVSLTGIAPADGMSYPYQLAVVVMSWLIIFLGLQYLRRFLRHYFPEWPVALTILGVGIGTNLFYYAVEKPDMTHMYLFAGYALLLSHFGKILDEEKEPISKRLSPSYLKFAFIAAVLCLIRSSEIVLFAIPALHGLRDLATFRRNFLRTLIPFLTTLVVFTLFQLSFYKAGTGQWFRDGYAGLGFDWANPHLFDGFFSYRRGWLIYTPLMALSLAGILWLRKDWFLPILVFTVANCYLLFSWHIWWYGNTFGSRPVVQSYAVLALPLTALLSWFLGGDAGARERWKKVVLGGLFTLFIGLNLFQHWQYNRRIIPLDFTNKTYYWHVFGKTSLDKKDRVYLDTNEKLPGGDWHTASLHRIDTLVTQPPKSSREFTNLLEAKPSPENEGLWLRSKLNFSYHGDSYDKWKFPSIVTEHKRGDQTLKWVQVKVPPTINTPESDSLTFHISLPGFQPGDLIKQYLWNLSQDSMAVYHYQAELLGR